MQGTIITLNNQRNSGFIMGNDKVRYYFRYNEVAGGADQLQEGQKVRFDTRPPAAGASNPQAVSIFLGEELDDQNPGTYKMVGTNTAFLNPYNFVRYLPWPPDQKADRNHPGGAGLLGRCQPPTHDRYLGFTGRITCEAKTITPLFVSDSHGISINDKKHRTYKFFRLNGQKAVPATSLRGMIRSVFEAATNSCLCGIEDRRLSYRPKANDSLNLVPARACKQENGQFTFELYPGTTEIGEQRSGYLYAAWVKAYQLGRYAAQGNDYANRPVVLNDQYMHGQKVWALLETCVRPPRQKQRPIKFWNVKQLADDRATLPTPKQGQRIEEGWLCITNQNIERKHDERFFFRGTQPGDAQNPLYAIVPINSKVVDDYEALLLDYQELHKKEIEQWKKEGRDPLRRTATGSKMAFSAHIVRAECKLKDGDLVYVGVKREKRNELVVTKIYPVIISRSIYDLSPQDLLPEGLYPCASADSLCPACRMFGWVKAQDDEDKKASVAYRGRVRFSHGTFQSNPPECRANIPLSILSSPNPTSTRFYLAKKNGTTPNGGSDYTYNQQHILRGRKIYRHHGGFSLANGQKATAGEIIHFGELSDQNRTVADAIDKNAVFTFTIDFENLAPLELGALLWTLELKGDDWQGYHRLGYAKPLGFGSLKIKVSSLKTLDYSRRYLAVEGSGWIEWTETERTQAVRIFTESMQKLYSMQGAPFEGLAPIADLRRLLAEVPEYPIHYPRPNRQRDPQGKNFLWFVGNKKNNASYSLGLPGNEQHGLPYIKSDGSITYKG